MNGRPGIARTGNGFRFIAPLVFMTLYCASNPRLGIEPSPSPRQTLIGQPAAGAHLKALSMNPAPGHVLKADDTIKMVVDYRISRMRPESRYGLVPFFRDSNGGAFTEVANIVGVVELTESEGRVTLKYPVYAPLQNPGLARPPIMWISLVEESANSAVPRVVASLGPFAFK